MGNSSSADFYDLQRVKRQQLLKNIEIEMKIRNLEEMCDKRIKHLEYMLSLSEKDRKFYELQLRKTRIKNQSNLLKQLSLEKQKEIDQKEMDQLCQEWEEIRGKGKID